MGIHLFTHQYATYRPPVDRRVEMDLGCGKGGYLLAMAERFPETHYIGADIMLEYSFVRRHLRALRLMETLENGGIPKHAGELYCSLGHGLQTSNLFAMQALKATGGDPALEEQIVHDTLHYLILHEIGHTLGLNHNMRATQILSPDEAFDPSVVEEKGLAGSVMDYPAINFAPPGREQTRFYAVRPGPYDDWAIEVGYSPEVEDPGVRQALLNRSTDPYLVFGNDAKRLVDQLGRDVVLPVF